MALAALFKDHKAKKCPRGMELSFRWRVKNNINNNLKVGQNNHNDNKLGSAGNQKGGGGGGGEIFEVRMDGVLIAKLTLPNIAADFFDKFITNKEPVSPLAKISFADNFPRLLSTKRSNSNNNNRQKRDSWNSNNNNSNNNGDMKGANTDGGSNNNKRKVVVTTVVNDDPIFLARISSTHFNVKRMVINAVQEMETHIHYPHNNHHSNNSRDKKNSNNYADTADYNNNQNSPSA